jgi:hypothetical protein
MYLHILFGQRKESYSGEYAPEALLCWTEYDIEENQAGFDRAVEIAQAEAKRDGFISTKMIQVQVNQAGIRALLLEPATIAGDIVP